MWYLTDPGSEIWDDRCNLRPQPIRLRHSPKCHTWKPWNNYLGSILGAKDGAERRGDLLVPLQWYNSHAIDT